MISERVHTNVFLLIRRHPAKEIY